MKNVLSLLLLVTFTNCGNTTSEKNAAADNSSAATENPAATKSASIKIFRKDKLVVEYKAQFPQGGITTFKSGEKYTVLKLSDDKNIYNLIATIEKPESGDYTIGKMGMGQASLQLTTDGKGPVYFFSNLTEGTFKMTITGETCSGSFSGTQKEAGLDDIKITGEFTSIPLMKNTVNY